MIFDLAQAVDTCMDSFKKLDERAAAEPWKSCVIRSADSWHTWPPLALPPSAPSLASVLYVDLHSNSESDCSDVSHIT